MIYPPTAIDDIKQKDKSQKILEKGKMGIIVFTFRLQIKSLERFTLQMPPMIIKRNAPQRISTTKKHP